MTKPWCAATLPAASGRVLLRTVKWSSLSSEGPAPASVGCVRGDHYNAAVDDIASDACSLFLCMLL